MNLMEIGKAMITVAQIAIARETELFLSSIKTSLTRIAIGMMITPIQWTSSNRLSISINETEIIISASGPSKLDLANGPKPSISSGTSRNGLIHC